jgi:hypothetical protein
MGIISFLVRNFTLILLFVGLVFSAVSDDRQGAV